jgi:hypothetical protein
MRRFSLPILILAGIFLTPPPLRAGDNGPEWETVTAYTMYYQGRADSPCLMCLYRGAGGIAINEPNDATTIALTNSGPSVFYYTGDWKKYATPSGKEGERRLDWHQENKVFWSEKTR